MNSFLIPRIFFSVTRYESVTLEAPFIGVIANYTSQHHVLLLLTRHSHVGTNDTATILLLLSKTRNSANSDCACSMLVTSGNSQDSNGLR